MSDVKIYLTSDGIEINVENGVVEMNDGLTTAVINALTGGNDEDPGGADKSKSWWGNALEDDPNEQLRSRTLYALQGWPATSANLRRLHTAVSKDLEPLIIGGFIEAPEIRIWIPRVDWVQIVIESEVVSVEILAEWRGPQ